MGVSIYVNQIGGQDELVFDGSSFSMAADGTIGVNTSSGCHLTQETVLETLHLRILRRKPVKTKGNSPTASTVAYREPAADIWRLIELGPARSITRKKVYHNRQARRERQLNRIAARIARQIVF